MADPKRFFVLLAGVLTLVCFASPSFAGQPATGGKKVLKLGAITIDRSARCVTLPAKVVKPAYGLEFLLCRSGSKEYESLLVTKARGDHLHGAMIILGLSPGLHGSRVGGKYLPPRGARLKIELIWTDAKGKLHTATPGDWMKMTAESAGQKTMPKEWVFVGSDFLADGQYLADVDGGLISVANRNSAVFDVPFESSKALESRCFEVDPAKLPKPGTAVTVKLTALPGAEKADEARAWLDIDELGQFQVDGRQFRRRYLRRWAEKFSARHSKAKVIIRSAGKAMCRFAAEAQTELKAGGILDFEHRTIPSEKPTMPLTVDQMDRLIDTLKDTLGDPNESPQVAAKEIRQALLELDRTRAELKRRDALLLKYKKLLLELQARVAKSQCTKPTADSEKK